jgi:hypothetical protein
MTKPKGAKVRYKATNWAAYNAALKARGSLTIWLDMDMDMDMQWCARPEASEDASRSSPTPRSSSA